MLSIPKGALLASDDTDKFFLKIFYVVVMFMCKLIVQETNRSDRF